ncbi:MAG: redoxin domain-containing protein [Proteobacteria bacterium]|nr:redoxin domain-containing protein [Pseudomonadota bacterium]
MIQLLLLSILVISIGAFGQGLPDVTIQTLKKQSIKASELTHDGPMVVSFWATWCKPCISELDAMADYHEDLVADANLRMVAISIDNARTSSRVAPFVASRGWNYDVYVDANSDLRRAMGVNNVPHTFLLNAQGEIVWESNRYVPGEEEVLIEQIEALAHNEKLKLNRGEIMRSQSTQQ